MLKPALIYETRNRWFAWNEDGILLCFRDSYDAMVMWLHNHYYKEVPPNSRLAATIRDKFRTKGYRV
jgi:hypothetical protein